MLTALIVLVVAALLAAAAGFWVLRAYRRAGADARAARGALLACAAAGAAALGAYMINGRPDLSGAPYQARLQAVMQRPISTYTLDELLAVLAEGARARPSDPTPHLWMGRVLLDNGRPQEAARSFDAALRRDPGSAAAMIGLGESITAMERRFTPEALALFQQAATLSEDPSPWMYQAMAARSEGRSAEAERLLEEALRRMAPDDPRREALQQLRSGTGR